MRKNGRHYLGHDMDDDFMSDESEDKVLHDLANFEIPLSPA